MSFTSVDFPLPLTPVTVTKHPSGNPTSMPSRLCSRASRTTSHASPGARRRSGTSMVRWRDRYWPGDRPWLGHELVERARDDDLAAVLTRPGTDVDDVVGDTDRLLVVLDHDDRVAELAQPDERVDQTLVVALVQADRRLVEHVQHTDEAAPDLRREADALRLASGERARRPVEAQVVEPHVEQEPKALVHLLEHRRGDQPVALRELELAEERARPSRSTCRRAR